MQTYKQADLAEVRKLKIGTTFRSGGLERTIAGVSFSRYRCEWCVEWSRRGSASVSRTRLRAWLKWQSGAEFVFDAIDGPWASDKAAAGAAR